MLYSLVIEMYYTKNINAINSFDKRAVKSWHVNFQVCKYL